MPGARSELGAAGPLGREGAVRVMGFLDFWFMLTQVQELALPCFKEDISTDGEADVHNLLEILVCLELPQDLLVCGKAEVLILNLSQLV